MGFVFGFLFGLLAAVALASAFAYWICTRSDTIALAKFINGVAQALAHRSKSPPVLPGDNGDGIRDAKQGAGERTWGPRRSPSSEVNT